MESSSPSPKQCGMCGACNSMPPWAPEALANATPAARKAIEQRMKDKQERFIAARDAMLAQQNKQRELRQTRESQKQKNDIKSMESTEEQDQNETTTTQIQNDINPSISTVTTPKDIERPLQLENGSILDKQRKKQNLQSTINDTSQLSTRITTSIMTKRNSTSLTDLDSDADSFHTAEEEDEEEDGQLNSNQLDDLQAIKLDSNDTENMNKIEQLNSPLFLNEKNQQSMNNSLNLASSLTVNNDFDNESDSDFINRLQNLQINNTNRNNNESNSNSANINATSHRQLQTESTIQMNKPLTRTNDENSNTANDEPILTITMEETTTKTNELNNMNIHTMNSNRPNDADLDDLWASDNLEEIVLEKKSQNLSKRRPPIRTIDMNSNPTHVSTNESLNDNENDMHVPLGKDVIQCEDCHAWRRKVVQLEEKVESLSSDLASKEIDLATLRAKIGDAGRHVPKTEARLIEECESLRVTTEFLFQKLERYERTVNGEKGDAH